MYRDKFLQFGIFLIFFFHLEKVTATVNKHYQFKNVATKASNLNNAMQSFVKC